MEHRPDQDAFALSLALRLLGLPADAEQIFHSLGRKGHVEEIDILRAARSMGAKAKACKSSVARLQEAPLPALAFFKDRGWAVIGKVTPALAIVQGGGDPCPKTLSLAEFAEAWNGRVILLASR
jgi:subfamily B ATP-binding cassette protein HlyB/CyaB